MIGGKRVDLVLGLSMTSADVRWVLVEGSTAEGATICRDAVDADTLDDVIAAVGENRLHAIGVTWATEAETAASTLLDALAARGLGNVITVSEQEAADALATGIADRGGYSQVAVCIVDPDDALVALVDADGVTTERVDPTVDGVTAVLAGSDGRPEAIFVLGSADDIDGFASSIDGVAAPVITAADADLALARGTALASAQAVNILETRQARWRLPSRIGALTSVVAAAVVVFVVSLSVALGLGLTPDTDSTVAQRDTVATTDQPARLPAAPSVAQAVPRCVALILHADHELNASTFAARVTAATLSDIYSAITAGSTTSRGGGCADHRRGRGAGGPATRSTATRVCSASACARLRSASAPAATAASRPDHRTHPDHRSVPPAEPVRVISGASCRAR